jgi:predicted dehydrogenase
VRVHAESMLSQRDGHEPEEGCAIVMRFANGVVGTFVLSDATPSPFNWESATGENPNIPKAKNPASSTYRIFGSNAVLSVPDMTRWAYGKGLERSWSSEMVAEDIGVREGSGSVPFEMQVKNFVGVVRGEEEPVCGGKDGLRALRVCEAVKKSMSTGLPVGVESSAADDVL